MKAKKPKPAPHPHHDVIVAFAKGQAIQLKLSGLWQDVAPDRAPTFDATSEYRIKPDTKEYHFRLCLWRKGRVIMPEIVHAPHFAEIEKSPQFIRWIGPEETYSAEI